MQKTFRTSTFAFSFLCNSQLLCNFLDWLCNHFGLLTCQFSGYTKKTYFIIRESLSRCCCFVSSKGNLPLKWLKFVFKEAYWTQTYYLALSRLKGQNLKVFFFYSIWIMTVTAVYLTHFYDFLLLDVTSVSRTLLGFLSSDNNVNN